MKISQYFTENRRSPNLFLCWAYLFFCWTSSTLASANLSCGITCPENITVSNDLNRCGAIVNYDFQLDTTCSDVTINYLGGMESGAFFPIGATIITIEVVDSNEISQANCTFEIDVEALFSLPVVTISGPSSLCQGDTILLSAGTFESYLWAPSGSTEATLEVTTAGHYTVLVRDKNGCYAKNAINIELIDCENTVEANFQISQDTACAQHFVQFTDLSMYNITERYLGFWKW